MAAGISRGVSAPTPEPAEMSAATEMTATTAMAASAVLCKSGMRRANEQGYGKGWDG
jgi:hypothetical protein